jgi:hypothetical protein
MTIDHSQMQRCVQVTVKEIVGEFLNLTWIDCFPFVFPILYSTILIVDQFVYKDLAVSAVPQAHVPIPSVAIRKGINVALFKQRSRIGLLSSFIDINFVVVISPLSWLCGC